MEEILHQMIWQNISKYPILYTVLNIQTVGFLAEFLNHQQYFLVHLCHFGYT